MVPASAAAVHLPQLPSRSDTKPTAATLPRWNALLADLCRAGRHTQALALLPPLLAASDGLTPDVFTLPLAAKSCGALRDSSAGRQLHALAAKLGLGDDPFVGNSLISMYGRCGRDRDAEKLFDRMPNRNLVSWNALMSAVSEAGLPRRGVDLFQECLVLGMAPDQATLVTVLPMCTALGWLETGRAVHGLAAKSGWDGEPPVSNVVVDMYAKCGEVADAERAFLRSSSLERNAVSWNVMLGCYARNGEADAAFGLLREMQQRMEDGGGVVPADEITVLSVLPVCWEVAKLRELHCFAIRRGLHLTGDMVPNALVAAYAKCGCLLHAHRVFAGIRSKTIGSWNAMIGAHAQNGDAGAAVQVFLGMVDSGIRPDWFSTGSLLLACAKLKHLLYGKAVHGFILRNGLDRDSCTINSLLSVYVQCQACASARLLFDNAMEEAKDEVSWNTMIAGYSQNGLPEESLQMFREMQQQQQQSVSTMGGGGGGGRRWPSLISATGALMACSQLSAVRLGKEMHCVALKAGYCEDSILACTIIDMYAKCGLVDDARAFFDRMEKQGDDDASPARAPWTAMITGYAVNGLGKEAVALYEEMRREGTEADELTYLGLLMACSHAGMVEQGLRLFRELRSGRLPAGVEHYGCVVAMLSRAGRFGDAMAAMEAMPGEADAKVLSSVLAGCHIHGEPGLGRKVAERLLELEPHKPEHYVLASNLYAGAGQWDEVAKLRRRLKDAGLRKEPGCSWIDVAGKVYTFVAGENSCDRPEVRRMWRQLEQRIRRIGYVPDTTAVLRELEEEGDKVEALRWHSEKQAMAFGLLMTAAPAKVRVLKNMRMCRDCHNAAKLISKATGREILVRDKTRFHHFRHGLCSCNDYW